MQDPTDGARWRRLNELFDALADAPPRTREERLRTLAAEDAALAAELARMLQGDDATGVLDHPLPSPVGDDVAPESPVPDRSGERVGPYRLLRLLGRGGMGEVYEAERADDDFAQRVAIKLLKRGMDSAALLARFTRERRILAQLDHPNIAHLLDGGVAADGTPYFAMDHVDGCAITEYARRHALDPRARVALLLQAADAVAYAQSCLVVHRDIKPSNLLVDAEGRVRVLDFGIAKLLDEQEQDRLTGTGGGVMTPGYGAPEQIRGEPVTTASDVYALGGVLFELLTGREPHPDRGQTPASWLRSVDREGGERPSAVVRMGDAARVNREYGATTQERISRALRGDLDLIVTTALHPDPLRRYPGVAQLGQDLRRWLAGRPIAAQPDTAGYRLRKFVARHRFAVGGATSVLLALVAGLAMALWQADVARRQALRADAATVVAERQAERARLVKEFVLSLFAESDPYARAQLQALSPAQLVAAGIARAGAELAGDPALRSDVLADLAQLQLSLGDPRSALPVLQDALTQTIAREGADSLAAARIESDLAAAQAAAGDFEGARTRAEHAVATLERTLGPDALDTARARGVLANILRGSAPEPALELARKVHATSAAQLGEDDPETLARLTDVGNALELLDRLDEAEAVFGQVLAGTERALGADDVRIVRPATVLADIYRRQHRYAEARPLLERAIAVARAQLAPDHPALGGPLMRYGDLLRRMGEYDGAEAALDQAADCFPPEAPQSAQVWMFRGGVARARGDNAAAAAAFGKAREVFLAALGPDSVFPWGAATEHGLALLALGRLEEADAVLDEALARQQAVAGDQSFDAAVTAGALGQLRRAQQRPEQARELHAQALAVLEPLYGSEHPTVLGLRLELARDLAALGRAAAAREQVDAVLAGVGTDPAAAALEAEARVESALLAEAAGDAERTQRDAARALELWQALPAAPTEAVARARALLSARRAP